MKSVYCISLKQLFFTAIIFFVMLGSYGCSIFEPYQEYLANMEYDKAKPEIEKQLSTATVPLKRMALWNNLGCCYEHMKEYEKALDCFKKSINAMPERGYYGYINLASLSYKLSRLEDAANYSKKAKEIIYKSQDLNLERRSAYADQTIRNLVIATDSYLQMKVKFHDLLAAFEFKDYRRAIELSKNILESDLYVTFGISNTINTVTEVDPGSLAALNGVVAGDKIIKIGETFFAESSFVDTFNVLTDIKIRDAFSEYFDKYGSTAHIIVCRKDRFIPLTIKLEYPEIERTKVILRQARRQLSAGITKENPILLKILHPKTLHEIKIPKKRQVQFDILVSAKNSIKKVSVNDMNCQAAKATVLEQTFLPGDAAKYSISLPLRLGKNSYIVKAFDSAGNICSEKIVVKGVQALSNNSNKIYERKVAVVIGINKYQYYPPLEAAVNDARRVGQQLSRMGFDHVIEIFDQDATRSRILRELSDELPAVMGANDALLVYFAGHGFTEDLSNGGVEGYIGMVDTNVENDRGTAISMASIHQLINNYHAKHILFVFDSCYSGLGLKRSIRRTNHPCNINDIVVKNALQKTAVQIITGGGKDELAREVKGFGVFTRAFLDVLESNDRNAKAYLLASDIGQTVRKLVTQRTNGEQNPLYGWLKGEGDFIFER